MVASLFFPYRFQQKITLLVRLVPFLLEISAKNIIALIFLIVKAWLFLICDL